MGVEEESPVRLFSFEQYRDSVLIVESMEIKRAIGETIQDLGFNVFVSDIVPENLSEFMCDNNVTFGLLHNVRLMDEKSIIKAIKKGKYIAVLKSGMVTRDHGFMYERLKAEGCLIEDQRYGRVYKNMLNELTLMRQATKYASLY